MTEILAPALALVVLVLAARRQLKKDRANESPEAQREAARDRVFREAEDDDSRCHQCGEITPCAAW